MGLLGYFSTAHDHPPKAQANAKINRAEINLFIGNLLEMTTENDWLRGSFLAVGKDGSTVSGGTSTLFLNRTVPCLLGILSFRFSLDHLLFILLKIGVGLVARFHFF